MRNYFNYFTEIEEYFAQKRGKHLLLSPLDWCLIELWKENGIPLHIALRGIDRSFESAGKRRSAPPRTLFYCHPAVLEAFEEYQQSRVGAREEEQGEGEVSPQVVQAYLEELQERLRAQAGPGFEQAAGRVATLLSEVSSRSRLDWAQVDRDLGEIGRTLAERLAEEMEETVLAELKKQAAVELRRYQRRLSREMYQRLKENYLHRKIREEFGLPEFSLFQLDLQISRN